MSAPGRAGGLLDNLVVVRQQLEERRVAVVEQLDLREIYSFFSYIEDSVSARAPTATKPS